MVNSLGSLAQRVRDNIISLSESSVKNSLDFDNLSAITYGGLRGVTGLQQGLVEDVPGSFINTVPNAVEAGL